jgi:hypothetical protein
VAPLVETPRTLTRSVAPAKDQRSVLMKGVGRQLHPRILRFGSRLSPAYQPRSPPRPAPLTSRILTRSEPGKPPATPGHKVRRVLARILVRDLGTGFTLCPPFEIGLISCAHGEGSDERPLNGRPLRLQWVASRKRQPRAWGLRVEKRGPQCFPPRSRCLLWVNRYRSLRRQCRPTTEMVWKRT